MRLTKLFIRFYKSFNYDYLKKSRLDPSQATPWEIVDEDQEKWYPYVEIPIDHKITTIVGANESGKSHLLSAIEKGISEKDITGEDITGEDFCRNSEFFTVTKGEFRFPDFGYEWKDLSDIEQDQVRKAANIPSEEQNFDCFLIFRTNKTDLIIYLSNGEGNYKQYRVNPEKINLFSKILPKPFRIDSKVALPDSVPIERIRIRAEGQKKSGRETTLLEQWQREEIDQILDTIATDKSSFTSQKGIDAGWRTLEDGRKVQASVPVEFYKIPIELGDDVKKINTLKRLLTDNGMSTDERKRREQEFDLAYKLICEVANVDPEFLLELTNNLLKAGKEGYSGAIIDRINKNLEENLNFPSWWVQDRDFRLVVSANNYHLRFAIRDRTGTTYSFSERSQGLKYFLSYYIQYKAHKLENEAPEILLMDEPDAYLSSQAQQDLLKIFKAFADGKDGKPPVQVVYVTHSPFLIDKNHAERIRVLEKGVEDEGTRVVEDAAKNHYEPLRSAFGAFVGETAFIGNCNLMVEGLSEQILIAGAAAHLNSCRDVSELETLDLNHLDLNHLTIIPAGVASNIPYLVYLALGQNIEQQPAMILLLNSNRESYEARNNLPKNENEKPLLSEEFILQIKEWSNEYKLTFSKETIAIELEDLIPLPICVVAARSYAKVFHANKSSVESITEDAINAKLIENVTVFKAIEACFKEQNLQIDKVGFARSVIDTIQQNNAINGIEEFQNNFKALFKCLNEIKIAALQKFNDKRISEKIRQLKATFFRDYPKSARHIDAAELFVKMENILDDSPAGIEAKKGIQKLRDQYKLDLEPTETIADYKKFEREVNKIHYKGRNDKNSLNQNATEVPRASNQFKNSSTKSSTRQKQNSSKGFETKK